MNPFYAQSQNLNQFITIMNWTSRLENVDTNLGYFKRLGWHPGLNLRSFSDISCTCCFGLLDQQPMSLSTRIFAGHLGHLELAAASLGNVVSNS
jgi:MATE family multidrug resistance protein